MELECPQCKALNPADSVFCGTCGATLAPDDAVPEATSPPGQVPDDAEEEMDAAGPEAHAEPSLPPPLPPDDVEEEVDAAEPEAPAEPAPPPPIPPDDVEEEMEAAGPEMPAEPEPPLPLPPDDEEVVVVVRESVVIEETTPTPAARTYYSEDDVVVTGQTVVLEDNIYALGSINSVSLETKPPNRIPSILLALLGALMAVLALTDILRDPILGILLTVGGLILLGIGVLLAATDRASYIVRLSTPSEEVDALALPDRDRAAQIVDAIDSALVDRV